MKLYHCTQEPLRLHGLNVADRDKKQFWRLPEELIRQLPECYEGLGRRCAGARLRFSTDSPRLLVRYTLEKVEVDIAIGLPGSAGVDVYAGTGPSAQYLGYAAPAAYSDSPVTVEKLLEKPAVMEAVTVNLPRNERLLSLEIGVEEGTAVTPPPDYTVENPILYYGSSITEGGCAPRPGTAYTSLLSRWLDADYFCYGFSGAAKGEQPMAEFLAAHPTPSLLVCDYDHNAPDAAHLEATHRPFFETVRRAQPTLPVLFLTRPDADSNPADSRKRQDSIYHTYQGAKSAGDENVWFLDGGLFFGHLGREECTVDGCHPNALGFYRMAEAIYPLARRILGLIP